MEPTPAILGWQRKPVFRVLPDLGGALFAVRQQVCRQGDFWSHLARATNTRHFHHGEGRLEVIHGDWLRIAALALDTKVGVVFLMLTLLIPLALSVPLALSIDRDRELLLVRRRETW